KVPNEATAVEAMFNIIERRSIPLLGIEQTNTDSVKKYSWVAAKNDKGKGASSIPKLFTSPHTGKAYPLDSLRKAGKKSKKIKGIITPDFKKYNNVAIEQGVLFNLNLYASNDGILPYGLGSLVFSKNVTVAGRLLQGKTLTEIGTLFDSMMTYYERLGINNESGYAELSLFVDSVLRPINEAFTANIDSTNYELTVPIDLLKKNPYAIRLLGVKTAEETGILQQVSKSVLPQIPFAETKNEPREFSLEQNYPNPFNPSTAISFQLSAISNVTLKIYNVLGQEVVTLIHSRLMEEGKHEVTFDASNLPSGMYFYRLTAGSYVSTKKLLLLK
ncbi:MAG: T9SS type A sorting domain-containing protein, partial [Ignavibacteriales bacterium]|nr:T9SS type A sorting domain-containing protein [Ignavibacteriales bacterium]